MNGTAKRQGAPRNMRLRVADRFASCAGADQLASRPHATLEAAERLPGGRSPHRRLESEAWGAPIRVRPGLRGGLLARVLGARYASPARVFREFEQLVALRSIGVPVAEPAFALAQRSGFFWRTALGTVDQPEAIDGAAWFSAARTTRQHVRAARAFGAALRALHDAGVRHGDLQLRNVLWVPDSSETCETSETDTPARCLLIDLDRAAGIARAASAPSVDTRPDPPGLGGPDRLRDWMRLQRSFEKTGLGRQLPARAQAAALAAYCRGDRELRRRLRAGSARERLRLGLHRIGWRRPPSLRRLALLVGSAIAITGLAPGLSGCRSDADAARATPLACIAPSADGTDCAERYAFLAVGDVGRTRAFAPLFEGQLAVAKGMDRLARGAPVQSLVFLGDNFYWDGLSEATLVSRIRANLVAPYCGFLRLDGPRSGEVESACGRARADRQPVDLFAVLGNHDLERPESPRLQREAVPRFLPDWRMPSGLAEAVELAPGLSLVLFESEPAIAEPERIRRALVEALLAARGPWLVLATHRPIATDDHGRFQLGGYPNFVRDAIAAADRPVQLVLAGHHHNLQAFAGGSGGGRIGLQLGLGSGSRAEGPLADAAHPELRFQHQALGFARVSLQGEGTAARLVATLHATPAWPVWPQPSAPPALAVFAADREGRVERLDADR